MNVEKLAHRLPVAEFEPLADPAEDREPPESSQMREFTDSARQAWQRVREGYENVTTAAFAQLVSVHDIVADRMGRESSLGSEERPRKYGAVYMAGAMVVNLAYSRATGFGLFDGVEDMALQPVAGPPVSREPVMLAGFGTGLRAADASDFVQAAPAADVQQPPVPTCEPNNLPFEPDDPGCTPEGWTPPWTSSGDGSKRIEPGLPHDIDPPPTEPIDPPAQGPTPAPLPDELPPVEDEEQPPATGQGYRFESAPLPGEYLWDYLERLGVPKAEIMPRLEEAAAELQHATGRNVEWHGYGECRWLEIDGRSDTPYLVDALEPYLANGMPG